MIDGDDVFIMGGHTCSFDVPQSAVYHYSAANPTEVPVQINDMPGKYLKPLYLLVL